MSEDDGTGYREKDCQADAKHEKGDWAERPTARFLRLLLDLPATSPSTTSRIRDWGGILPTYWFGADAL